MIGVARRCALQYQNVLFILFIKPCDCDSRSLRAPPTHLTQDSSSISSLSTSIAALLVFTTFGYIRRFISLLFPISFLLADLSVQFIQHILSRLSACLLAVSHTIMTVTSSIVLVRIGEDGVVRLILATPLFFWLAHMALLGTVPVVVGMVWCIVTLSSIAVRFFPTIFLQ
jgi:hypothetical protein